MGISALGRSRRGTTRRRTGESYMRGGVRGVGIYGILIVVGVISSIPLYWMVITSLKVAGKEFLFPPEWFPNPQVWSNYVDVWSIIPFIPRYTFNSFFISILATVGTMLSCSFVAFGFSRMNFPGKNVMFIILIGTLMMPTIITLVPTFILFKTLRMTDNPVPLIVPFWFGGGAFGGAFYVFLLRQFMMQLPRELDESGLVDGASYLRIYWQLILPLSGPALAATAIFSFIQHWNEFLFPLIFINEATWRPLALGVRFFLNTYIGCCARGATPWNLLMTASFLMLLPILFVFFFAQKYFIRGIALTGLAGK